MPEHFSQLYPKGPIMNDLLNAFGFLSQNIHIAGWCFLLALAWKVSAKVTKFLSGMEETAKKTREAAERAERMEDTMNTVATNHLPHLQQSMNEINDSLKGLRQDILTIVLNRTTTIQIKEEAHNKNA